MNKLKAKIVVGMGYGDEGKGVTVSHLVKESIKPIVIRFSGGQQAGHTAHVGDIKHVCANFGAGVLQGVSTYFTEHTTFYPVTIAREMEVLKRKGIKEPLLILHPMAKMTTPWDVWANRNCDDTLAHGSCGLGVGKTMSRDVENYKINAIDLLHLPTLREKTKQLVQKNWSPASIPHWLIKEIVEFWDAIEEIDWAVADYNFLKGYDTLIFEGSQGVLLDKDHGVFPNVTYANTTSKNAMEVCDILNIKKRHVYCITRAYHTRHGAGLFHEGEIELKETYHETNVTNQYQGDFKVAPLDYGLLDYAAAIETLYSREYKQTLMITCSNQVTLENIFDRRKLNFEWYNIKKSFSPYGEFKNY